jgi:hypothetical protein
VLLQGVQPVDGFLAKKLHLNLLEQELIGYLVVRASEQKTPQVADGGIEFLGFEQGHVAENEEMFLCSGDSNIQHIVGLVEKKRSVRIVAP